MLAIRSLLILAFVSAGCASSTPHLVSKPETIQQPSSTRVSKPASRQQSSSTLDTHAQHIVREELDAAVKEWKPAAAVAVVLDASTGHVLAVEGRDQERDDPTIATGRAYVTGSTLKTFLIAEALDAHTIEIDTTVDCAKRPYGKGFVSDGVPRGVLSITEVLGTSSNVGASRIYDTLGLDRLVVALRRFHFGEAPGRIPTVTDPKGMPAVMLAIGESVEATPMQVAAAYGAVLNDGMYYIPTTTAATKPGERVLSAETARTLTAMLETVVSNESGTGKLARIEGVRVAGKTGTAQLDDEGTRYASFVGTVLDSTPRLVTLVGLVAPRAGGSGPSAAAPVFARIAGRILREPARGSSGATN